jgi:gliding motility-associated-like protein
MQQFYRNQWKFLGIPVAILVFLGGVHAQVPTSPQTFSLSANNPISSRFLFVGGLNFVTASPASLSPGSVYSFLGDGNASGGPFRGSANYAYIFNYARTNPGDVPYRPFAGQSGGGDYRISFSSDGDTTTKSGNFKMNSMYLAIGAGNSATVTVQGFRAGKLVVQSDINISPGMPSGGSDPTSFTYTANDGFGGSDLSFGTRYSYLDGLRFLISSTDIPLAIDDLSFGAPDTFSPATQDATMQASNVTGITSTLGWSRTIEGDYSAVFVKADNTGLGSPVLSPGTTYTANATFGNAGSQVGTSGWYCVYNGQASSAAVSGLATGTTYRTITFAYNGNVGSQEYKTTVGTNAANFTTITAPASQAHTVNIPVSTITAAAADISWTNGTGSSRVVFITPAASGTVAPVNNTVYTANTSFGSGSAITSGTIWRCVYNGTGSAVSVTNLSANTTYRVMVTEYNDNGSGGGQTYSIASGSGNPNNFTTDAVPAVTSSVATAISSSGATLNGSVDDRGATTNVSFEYATNSLLTSPSTLTGSPSTVAANAGLSSVTGTLSGLSASTVYYYRVKGVNAVGTVTGSIFSLTTSPQVSSVSASTPNGSYKATGLIAVTIVFSSAVTVTGAPTLALNSGGAATYASGSGTATLTFNYTIAGGDASTDLDYIAISSLALSGGTIKDIFGRDASLVLPAVGGASSLGGQKNIVIDTQVPVLGTVTIVSGNASPILAKAGDVITLSFAANETIIPTVSIAGHAITATNSGGNNWTATHTMVSGDATGVVSFNISFNDLAENAGTVVSATTNSSSVSFDKTAPGLSGATIVSNNANTALAKVGNAITLSFTADETIVSPTVTISGHTVAVTNTGSNNWTANYTMITGDAPGAVPFNISFSDLAGNAGTAVTVSTNSSSVSFDKTAPSLTVVTIVSNNANTAMAKVGDLITLSFTSNETIVSPAVTITGHTAAVTNTGSNNWTATYAMITGDAPGAVPFNISFSDLAGNAGTAVTATTNSSNVSFDKTAPSLTVVTIVSNNTNTALAKVGDMISLTFTSGETILPPTVTITGHTAAITNTGSNNWTATYVMITGDAPGAIPFNISFSDLAGNAGTAVTATTNSSNVSFDKTAPSLTVVTIVSNNANTALAKVGDMITLSFTSNETIVTPVVTIAGGTAAITNTGSNNWTATYALVSGDTQGAIPFNISFSDLAGNAGTAVTATTNSSSVSFDKIAPLLTVVAIVSNNANTAFAKVGDVITLSFTSNETIVTPTVTIAGGTAAITNTGSNNWTATYALVSGDTQGAIPFNISFSDLAGNAGTAVTATTNSSSVSFDKTAPLFTIVAVVSNNANTALAKVGDVISLTFTSGETILPPTVTITGHTAAITNTGSNNWTATYAMITGDAPGAIPFNISFSDLAGNAGTAVTATTNSSNVSFDKTAPSLTVVSIISNNANTALAKVGNAITLSFTADEMIVSPTVTISGHTVAVTNTGSNNWTANYTVITGDAPGAVPFNISFSDLAGNAGTAVTSTTNSSSVSFDKTAPSLTVVTIVSNNANTAFAKVGDMIILSFTSNETIVTPVVTIAGATAAITNTGSNNWTATYAMITGDALGAVPFNISFSDLAGNAGTAVTATTNSSSVSFDKAVPSLTVVTIVSNNANIAIATVGDMITLSFTSNETIVTPVVTVAGNTVAATHTGSNNWTATYTMVTGNASGAIPFNISFSDLAGNAGTAVSASTNSSSVSFDKTVPLITVVTIASNNVNTALARTGDVIILNFTSSETIAPPTVIIDGHTLTASNIVANNWRAVYTMVSGDPAGSISFSILFSDLAGNAGVTTATTNSSKVIFDRTAPLLTAILIGSNNAITSKARTGDKVTVSFTSNEPIATPSVILAGNTTAVTNTGGNNWTADYIMAATDAEGSIGFNIIFGDVTGNAGTAVAATTNSSDVVFDRTQPAVINITRLSSSPTNAASVQYTVTFSEAVSGVDAADFSLTTAALSGAAAVSVSGSNDTYVVTVNTGTGDGTLRLDLNSSGTGIIDLSGNPISTGYTAGQVYTISKIGLPVVTVNPANKSICPGSNPIFSVTATSSDALAYQWQADNGNGFVNLTNTPPYSNVTTVVLTVTNATASLNNYQYRCIITNSTGSVISNTALLTVNALPTVGAITGATGVCMNNTTALTSTTTGGVWTSSNTAIATTAGGLVTGIAAGTAIINYTVTNVNSCVAIVTASVTVNPLPTVTVQPNPGFISRGNGIRLTATGSAGTTIAWTPAASMDDAASFTPLARPLENTNYTATVTTNAGCKASVTVTVLSTEDFSLLSPAILFTPNGDGINDRFVIANIDAYPVNSLQVFNKMGKLVFQATNYHNEWDGLLNGKPLTSDTYYYILKVREVVIKRGAINVLTR